MKQQKLFTILERIELQQKAIWWDNILFSFGIVSLLSILLNKNTFFIFFSLIFFLMIFIFIQIFEHLEMKMIKRFYKNRK